MEFKAFIDSVNAEREKQKVVQQEAISYEKSTRRRRRRKHKSVNDVSTIVAEDGFLSKNKEKSINATLFHDELNEWNGFKIDLHPLNMESVNSIVERRSCKKTKYLCEGSKSNENCL
jgi:hypothetical protein